MPHPCANCHWLGGREMVAFRPMPDLIKFVAKQYAIGLVMVALFAVTLLVTDAWGLGTLVRSDVTPLTTAVIGSSTIFAGIFVSLLISTSKPRNCAPPPAK